MTIWLGAVAPPSSQSGSGNFGLALPFGLMVPRFVTALTAAVLIVLNIKLLYDLLPG